MESNMTFATVKEQSSTNNLFISTLICLGAGLLFTVPTTMQLGFKSLLGLLVLAGLITAVSYLSQQHTLHLPARWGNTPMLLGLMLWTAGWVIAALTRGVAGHLPIMLGLLAFGIGMLLMGWNSSPAWVWKAALVANLAPALLQLLSPTAASTLSAGTQFYLMFLYSIGWVLMVIQQKR